MEISLSQVKFGFSHLFYSVYIYWFKAKKNKTQPTTKYWRMTEKKTYFENLKYTKTKLEILKKYQIWKNREIIFGIPVWLKLVSLDPGNFVIFVNFKILARLVCELIQKSSIFTWNRYVSNNDWSVPRSLNMVKRTVHRYRNNQRHVDCYTTWPQIQTHCG